MDTDDTEFVRRKFTLTAQLDNELEEAASDHYQGNVSLFLRQAIIDHQETLNGGGQLEMKRLVKIVRGIQNDVDDLREITERVSGQEQSRNRPSGRHRSVSVEPKLSKSPAAQQIIQVIQNADCPPRAEDIVQHVDQPPRVVRHTLGLLIDRSYLSMTSDTPSRYRRISAETNSEDTFSDTGGQR